MRRDDPRHLLARARAAAPVAPPGLIDRAIAALSPAWALERQRARAQLAGQAGGAAAVAGGYTAAGYSDRLFYWQPGSRDADSDTLGDLRELRARSRDLVRNSPIAAGAIDTQCAYIVGSGLTLQSRIDAAALGLTDEQAAAWQTATERRWRLWASSSLCDAAGEHTFADFQDLALRTQLESGDAVLILARKPRPGWPFSLALQLVEADRICNPQFGADSATRVDGIERDDSGEPVAAHICSRHPGSLLGTVGATWTRVPLRGASGRRNALHLKRALRPGQTRGVPVLAPIIATLKQMTRYSDAEIDAAVNAAAQAVFVKMDPDTFTELFDDEAQASVVDAAKRWDGTLKSGSAINLLPGEDITAPELGRPNPNFDPFMQAFLRFVGIGLSIPHEVLAKAFNSSYSAARAALLDAWRTFGIRRVAHAAKLCQPVFEEWLAEEVAAGAIAAPGFFADVQVRAAWCGATWSGDGPGSLDPLKEAYAARERISQGLTTLSEETVAYDGGDWEQKHRQRAREHAVRLQAGLEPPVTAPGAPPPLPGDPPPAKEPA